MTWPINDSSVFLEQPGGGSWLYLYAGRAGRDARFVAAAVDTGFVFSNGWFKDPFAAQFDQFLINWVGQWSDPDPEKRFAGRRHGW